jgi:hypothetical protein
MFEKMVLKENPTRWKLVMEWMLGCVTIEDHNENIRISKGKIARKRKTN